jgi:uncharacterized membrane protein YjjP (DUF1212 family)
MQQDRNTALTVALDAGKIAAGIAVYALLGWQATIIAAVAFVVGLTVGLTR